MSLAPGSLAASAVIVAIGVAIARLRPEWVLPVLLAAVPLRFPLVSVAELPTLLVIGTALGRLTAVAQTVARAPLATAAVLALPAWIAISALWSRSAYFAFPAAGSWLLVGLALFVAAGEPVRDPRLPVLGALVGLVPIALWAVAERTQVVLPRGDPAELRARLIIAHGVVRARVLFVHPNRLAEYMDEMGVFLAGPTAAGPWQVVAALGVLLAFAGSWASGSDAGMATIAAGTVLTVAWLYSRRFGGAADRSPAARRLVAAAFIGIAVAGGIAAALIAYRAHGGLASRKFVYRFALDVIRQHPVLGLGGGNWVFAVASAPLWMRHNLAFFGPHAHSLVLQLWVELGIVGVVLGGLFFAVPLWTGLRSLAGERAASGVAAGAIAAVLALLAHNLVSYFLTQPANGIAPGLLLGIALRAGIEKRVSRS